MPLLENITKMPKAIEALELGAENVEQQVQFVVVDPNPDPARALRRLFRGGGSRCHEMTTKSM